jgi:dihydropteroate synthase
VVAEVRGFLEKRAAAAMQAGIARERIVIDPGFGFGKTVQHNLEILRNLSKFTALGPVLAGWSRKSTLGKLTGRPAEERLAASLAAALLALQGGATILRVHDVRETQDVIAVWEAYRENAAR